MPSDQDHAIRASGTVAWLSESERATKDDFQKMGRDVVVELWSSVKDAVRMSVDNTKTGLKPWLMVRGRIFSPEELASARAWFIYDDALTTHSSSRLGPPRLEPNKQVR
jgi:hypothetical protein